MVLHRILSLFNRDLTRDEVGGVREDEGNLQTYLSLTEYGSFLFNRHGLILTEGGGDDWKEEGKIPVTEEVRVFN